MHSFIKKIFFSAMLVSLVLVAVSARQANAETAGSLEIRAVQPNGNSITSSDPFMFGYDSVQLANYETNTLSGRTVSYTPPEGVVLKWSGIFPVWSGDPIVGKRVARISMKSLCDVGGCIVTGVATCNTPGCTLNNPNDYTTNGLSCVINNPNHAFGVPHMWDCSFTPPDVTAGGKTKVAFMVKSAGLPTVNISANPSVVAPGGSSLITWSSTNAESCSMSGGAPNGSLSVGPFTYGTWTYPIQCTSFNGILSSTVQAIVSVSNSSGSLEVKRINASYSAFSSPETSAWYDNVAPATANSRIFSSVPTGTHTVSVSVPAGYMVTGVGVCNTSGCSLTSSLDYKTDGLVCTSAVCSYSPAAVSSGNLTRVIFMYSQAPSGSLEIKRVGRDYLTSSIPATSAWYDSVAPSNENGHIFTNVSVGAHEAKVSVPSGYAVTGVATCNTSGCSMINPNSYTSDGLSCADSVCSFSANVTANSNRRVAFMYETLPTPPEPPEPTEPPVPPTPPTPPVPPVVDIGGANCRPEDVAHNPLVQQYIGVPVVWSVISPNPTAMYIWKDGNGAEIGSGQTLTKVYTTTGNKIVTLTTVPHGGAASTIAECHVLSGGKLFKVILDPAIKEF